MSSLVGVMRASARIRVTHSRAGSKVAEFTSGRQIPDGDTARLLGDCGERDARIGT
jgi:hypothetical protein